MIQFGLCRVMSKGALDDHFQQGEGGEQRVTV